MMPLVMAEISRLAAAKSLRPKMVPTMEGIRLQIPPTEMPTMNTPIHITTTEADMQIRQIRATTYHTQ